MDEFEQIEEKYGLVLPAAYRSMSAAGWFDVKSDNYFWLHEAEWMSLAEMLHYEPADYHRPEFLPFATTAGGSYWCWWPSAHPDTVVFCPRDSYDGEFYAPTFVSFIYRSLLDFSMTGFDPQKDAEEDAENRRILKDSVARLSDYLPDIWCETLKSLPAAPSVRWYYKGREAGCGLMTWEQKQGIIERDLAFPMLDQEFQWMYPLFGEEEETAAILRKVILESGPTVSIEEKIVQVEAEKARRKNDA